MLEPKGPDSYFNWNFYDEILQQKEWFSSYVFEETAYEILQENPELRKEFDEKRLSDTPFTNNAFAQLYWIYKHSSYYESAHLRYPVYRSY